MSNGVISLGPLDLALSYGMVLLTLGMIRMVRIGQEKPLIIAALRMLVQLLAVGVILVWLFSLAHPAAVFLILFVMLIFAVITIAGRIPRKMPGFYPIVGLSLLFGCGSAFALFVWGIIGVTPWYDPRYLIPLAGMIIGNSMTGATLAAERLDSELRGRRLEIETALSLGASAREASLPAIRAAFGAALTPPINAMASMGIVFLPGMMTGQILSGTEPLVAVCYQIAIMCMITGAVALTALSILVFGVRAYFTPAQQLALPIGTSKGSA